MCICGQETKGIVITYSIVRVRTYHCNQCKRVFREFELVVERRRANILNELERLHHTQSRQATDLRKVVIDYLERLLDASPPDPDQARTFRQRREDLWERRYLKQALGDDYYA